MSNQYAVVNKTTKSVICKDPKGNLTWKTYKEDEAGRLILDPALNFLCFSSKRIADKVFKDSMVGVETILLYGFLCYGDYEERSINGSLR